MGQREYHEEADLSAFREHVLVCLRALSAVRKGAALSAVEPLRLERMTEDDRQQEWSYRVFVGGEEVGAVLQKAGQGNDGWDRYAAEVRAHRDTGRPWLDQRFGMGLGSAVSLVLVMDDRFQLNGDAANAGYGWQSRYYDRLDREREARIAARRWR